MSQIVYLGIYILATLTCCNCVFLRFKSNNLTYTPLSGQNLPASPLDGFHSNLFLNNPWYAINENLAHDDTRGRPPRNQNGKLKILNILSKLFLQSQNGAQQQQSPLNEFQRPPNSQNGGQQGPPLNGFNGQRPQNGPQGPPNGFLGPPFNGSNFQIGGPPQGMPPPTFNNGNINTFMPPPPPNMLNNLPLPAYKGCKGLSVMSNLDINKLVGKWFSLAVWTSNNQSTNVTCFEQIISLNGSNVNLARLTTLPNKAVINESDPIPKQSLSNGDSIKIIDTDYSNYAIWINCANKNTDIETVVVSVRSSMNNYYDPNIFNRIGNELGGVIGIAPWQMPRVGRTACSL